MHVFCLVFPFSKQISPICTKVWRKVVPQVLPSVAQTVRVVSQQLWCCCLDGGIVVLDKNLLQQRIIPCAEKECVYDVVDFGNCDVVIASSRGLLHADIGGNYWQIPYSFCLHITKSK